MWVKNYDWDDPEELKEVQKLFISDAGNWYAEIGGSMYSLKIMVSSPDGYTSAKLEAHPVAGSGFIIN